MSHCEDSFPVVSYFKGFLGKISFCKVFEEMLENKIKILFVYSFQIDLITMLRIYLYVPAFYTAIFSSSSYVPFIYEDYFLLLS